MRLRWTILLVVINAVLIWLVAGGILKPATHRTFEAQIRSFLPLQKGEWDTLALSTPNGEWKAQKDSWGRWWLKSPIEWPGRTERFSKMVAFLTTLKIESAFSAHQLKRVGQSLRSYGLEKPQAILEIGSQGKTLTYKIGAATPLGEKLYVLSPKDDEIWVVSRDLLNYTDPAFEPYRAEGFFPFNVVELENVNVQIDGLSLKVERKQNSDHWQLTFDNSSMDVVDGAWESFLEKLSQLAPAEFIALDASEQGLKTPVGRMIFKTLYGRRALLIGSMANSQERWVQWEGSKSVFTLPQAILDELKAESFIGKTLLGASLSNVDQIVWESGSKKISLVRNEDDWSVVDGETAYAADTTAVKQYLVYLASEELEVHFEVSQLPPSAPSLAIKMKDGTLAYRFDDDLTHASIGEIRYDFDSAFKSPDVEQLKSRLMGVVPEADLLRVEVGGNVEPRVYLKDTPVFSAALALLEKPEVKHWAEGAEMPADSLLLKATWSNESAWEISFWQTQDNGWLAAYEGKVFEPTPEWVALFENVTNQ